MTAHARGGEGRPRTAAAALEHDINPLQRLIQQRLRERGWSYGQVARRGGLPRSTVHTLAATRNLTRPPRPATIDALAKGLEVPVAAVRAAAAESIARHYYDRAPAEPGHPADREKELLIASIDELMPEDRRHVAALVDSLRNKTSPEPGGPLAPAPCGHVYFLLRISVPRAGAGSAIATRGSRAAALGPLRSIASNRGSRSTRRKTTNIADLRGCCLDR